MARQATQTTASSPEAAAVVARSPYLDASLDRAHKLAVGQHHPGVSSEHLLFALTEDPDALVVLGASTITIERLRADISTHLTQLPNDTPPNKPVLPTADLLKVLKLAAMAAQQSSRRQIDGAIVLAAMIGDATTPSAGLLRAHGLTFSEVIRVLQRGALSAPMNPQATEESAADPSLPAPAPAPTAIPARSGEASTDEILASVRARLQDAAPPAIVRRAAAETTRVTPPAMPEAAAPETPAVVAVKNVPTKEATSTIPDGRASPQPSPAPQTAAPATAAPVPVQPEMRGTPPSNPPGSNPPPALPSAQPNLRVTADGYRAPDEFVQAPAATAMPPPIPAVAHMPPMPPPLLPASASPTPMPPPLAASTKPNAPPPLTATAAPTALAQPAPARETPRMAPPPPIPPVTVDMRALANAMPKFMRHGQTDVIEISVPRRALEIPLAQGHRWPPLRVTTLRLKAVDDRAFVEMASPETLWIGPSRAHQGADDAIWRWRVSPRHNGRLRLTVAGATRIVGSEGISAEIPFGEETVEIEVSRRRSRRGFVGVLLFGNLLAIGVLAMIMSGRAAEIVRSAWSGLASLWGG